jgi:hypothetical protein
MKSFFTPLLVVCAFGLVSCSVEHKRIAEEGQPIIRAIYQYKRNTGNYPENLSALVPEYLKEAPFEDWKRGWKYSPADSRGFTSGFMLSRFSVGYKTRVEYIDDGTAVGWRVNAEGDKTPLDLPNMKQTTSGSTGSNTTKVIRQ